MKKFNEHELDMLIDGSIVKTFGGKYIREYIAPTFKLRNGRLAIEIQGTQILFCTPVWIKDVETVYVCETTDYYKNTHHVFIDTYERR